MNKIIPFNKPYLSGREILYISEVLESGKTSGDGKFTKACHSFFEKKYSIRKSLLTTSCTDALEMAAILLNISSGDEVIMPSYTFVSTANAFALRGARIIFVDSVTNHPNVCPHQIEMAITARTKAIVVVHYAGIACKMDEILELAGKYGIPVVEDAAQAVDSFYKGRPLGSLGDFGTFSFHETKNIISGEGGMLCVNGEEHIARAEIIRDKGTNRSAFFRGEVDKYGWVDIGSSYLPSEISAAFLYAQLEAMDLIQNRRRSIWNRYFNNLANNISQFGASLPVVPEWSSNNAHIFYIICASLKQRTHLIASLKDHGVSSAFHYLSLHKSSYFHEEYNGPDLPNSDRYSDCLLRLPLYYEMSNEQCDLVSQLVISALSEFY